MLVLIGVMLIAFAYSFISTSSESKKLEVRCENIESEEEKTARQQ